jgi:hypothetical protein
MNSGGINVQMSKLSMAVAPTTHIKPVPLSSCNPYTIFFSSSSIGKKKANHPVEFTASTITSHTE